jgi:hypothetical protein
MGKHPYGLKHIGIIRTPQGFRAIKQLVDLQVKLLHRLIEPLLFQRNAFGNEIVNRNRGSCKTTWPSAMPSASARRANDGCACGQRQLPLPRHFAELAEGNNLGQHHGRGLHASSSSE